MTKEEIVIGGLYKHYRNKKTYKIIGVGKHEATGDELVFYEAQYDAENKYWARDLSSFCAQVEQDGKKTPRFTRVG